MKATVEPVEGNKVKLSVSVEEDEFDKAVDAAFRKLAKEVRIPGFRPGKAPRRVLEARFGGGVGRQQALQDALPDYYADAVREHEVDVIAPPEIEVTEGEESGPVAFEAVVEIRPTIEVPGYGSLRVTIDAPEATDEEIDAQLERLRSQFGELEAVDRPAVDGDYATIDVEGSQDGEAIEQLTAEDYLYEVGSGGILPEVDGELRGAKVGDIVTFTAAHPADEDATLDFRILVKDVKERVLPELDDEFANEASEFETLDELRADLAERLSTVKLAQARLAVRERTGEALAELVDDEIPDALVDGELQNRLNDLAMRAQAQGLSLEQWLAMSGRSPEELVAELRAGALLAAKVDLALRAVADAEGIECTDEDLEEELAGVAARLQLDTDDVRAQFERAGQMGAVRSDIRKRKAFELVLERAEVVDQDGNPVDRDLLEEDEEPSDDEPGDEVGDGGDTVAEPVGEAADDEPEQHEDGDE